MTKRVHAVIMAGGSGTRFWPASRSERPKQLLPLARGRSLIEATVERLAGFAPRERTWIVTTAGQVAPLRRTLAFDPARIIVEPEPRDTAACIALSVARLEAVDAGAIVAILPSDHLIEPAPRFVELLQASAELASDRKTLVTLGIKPTYPATGFGYIEPGEPIGDSGARRVAQFREKPNLDAAREFVGSGRFLWNSGIFVLTADAMLRAMEAGNPRLATCTHAMIDAARRGDDAALREAFLRTPKTSFDYAVMERAPSAAVIDADVTWNDLGSFLALDAIAPPDQAGNVQALIDGARATLLGAHDCVVYAEGPRTVALLGTHDLVCVAVDDAVLVCPKHRIDDMKALVQKLREDGREDLL